MTELAHLIEVHPTRGVAFGVLVPHDRGPDDVLLIIDLGYSSSDHEVARDHLSKLLSQGFKIVSGVDEVYPPVNRWSYRAEMGATPETTTITVLAEMKRKLVYSGLFLSSPTWFEREDTSRSTAVAIGNFSLLDANPLDDPRFFTSHLEALVKASMATNQVVGASIGRIARR